MPRYRFAWGNVAPPVLSSLSDALSLGGESAVVLRERFGARPRARFIEETWPTLVATWLRADSASRQSIVTALVAAELGQYTANVNTEQEQLDYLASCRNAQRLREIVLAAFLLTGEPRPVDVPSSPPPSPLPSNAPGAATTTAQEGPDSKDPEVDFASYYSPSADLDEWIDAFVKLRFEISEVRRDDDGDIPLPLRGSASLFIRRPAQESPLLEIFAPLLRGLEITPDVYEAANSLNAQLALAKVTVWADSKVMVMNTHLLTETLSAQQLNATLDRVSAAADHFDTLLKKRFGGDTMGNDLDGEIDV